MRPVAITSPGPLESRFEHEIGRIVDASRRACLRLLPWAVDEHENIVQEAVARALDNVRAGKLASDDVDLAGYVYGITRHCIQEAKRRRYLAEIRACALPEDDFLAVLDDDIAAISRETEQACEEVARRRLLEVLRFHVTHMFATATEKKRRRVLRDSYIVARHHLRGTPLAQIAEELGLTRRACQYALDRTYRDLAELFHPDTREVRSFVENSASFAGVSELSDFLRRMLGDPPP